MLYTYNVEDDDIQRLYDRLDKVFGAANWRVVDCDYELVPFLWWFPFWPKLQKITSITVEFS